MRRCGWIVAMGMAFGLLVPAAAGAEVRSGGGDDDTGEASTGGVAARDIRSVEGSYDTDGKLTATVRLGASPTGPANNSTFGVVFGERNASGGCTAPLGLLIGQTLSGPVTWVRDDDGASPNEASGDNGERSGSAGTVTFSATQPPLAGRPFNCFLASLRNVADAAQVYDSTGGWFRLNAPEPPPPPPQPDPPRPAPEPRPEPAPVPEPAPLAPPAFALEPVKAPEVFKRGRSTTVAVKVTNAGAAEARDVIVRAARLRGVKVSPASKRIKAIKAGKSATARFKVRPTRTFADPVDLGLTAKNKAGLNAANVLKVATKRPDPRKALVGRQFWRNEVAADTVDYFGVYFVDGEYAYRGLPKGGLPACTAVTAVEDKDGCVKYSYDPKSGAVILGDKPGSFKDGKLSIEDEEYKPLITPLPGTLFSLRLEHRGYRGFCGLITGCTTWRYVIQLGGDGQFISDRSTTTTVGDPGFGPFTAAGSNRPDVRGTYAVAPGGKIVLSFADGKIETRTIGVELNAGGAPDPTGTGIVLDDENYYPID